MPTPEVCIARCMDPGIDVSKQQLLQLWQQCVRGEKLQSASHSASIQTSLLQQQENKINDHFHKLPQLPVFTVHHTLPYAVNLEHSQSHYYINNTNMVVSHAQNKLYIRGKVHKL